MTIDSPNQPPGRVMALDLGEKRIGIALSDPMRVIASAHSVYARRSRVEDAAHYAKLIADNRVALLVLGLPLTLGGQEGRQAAWVRDYGDELAARLPVPVVFWDESLTTQRAETALRAQGHRAGKMRKRVDVVAAVLILQDYLDAQRGVTADGQ